MKVLKVLLELFINLYTNFSFPLLLLFVVLIFRKQFKRLLSSLISLKAGDIEIGFSEQAEMQLKKLSAEKNNNSAKLAQNIDDDQLNSNSDMKSAYADAFRKGRQPLVSVPYSFIRIFADTLNQLSMVKLENEIVYISSKTMLIESVSLFINLFQDVLNDTMIHDIISVIDLDEEWQQLSKTEKLRNHSTYQKIIDITISNIENILLD
ncbi:hypothetical protein ABE871_18200 [Enterococcus gilvus]|uniref:hypothetical protein n=1 Tax=Enterococcus gilvus TaxID=160453 RepID=UPI003D6B6D16